MRRYPGGKPFTKEQRVLFNGRAQETQHLFQLICLEPVVVLFGKSGYGKSSLLNAGLVPLIEKKKNYFPLEVRLNAWTPETRVNPTEKLENLLKALPHHSSPIDKITSKYKSLWYYAKSRQFLTDTRLLLIFDQFEELFSYPEEEILTFKEELATLLKQSLPDHFETLFSIADSRGKVPISQEEEDLLFSPLNVHFLFSIRSDRLHLMDQLSDRIPPILKNNFELNALHEKEARSALVEPAMLDSGGFESTAFKYSDSAINYIIDFLKGKDNGLIEAIQLQILGTSFENRVIEEGINTFTFENLGDLKAIIDNYYHDQLNKIQSPANRNLAALLLEDGLVDKDRKQRLTLHESQIEDIFDVSPALLDELVNNNLLRREPDRRQGYTYELSHDTLISPVLKARAKRIEREKEREAERIEYERAEMLRKERRKRRIAYLIGTFGFLLAAIALLASVYAFGARKKAQEAEQEAIKNAQRAQKALSEAELARLKTEEALDETQIARLRAIDASEETNKQKERVESLLITARENERIAKSAQNAALAEAKRANSNFLLFRGNEAIKEKAFKQARTLLHQAALADTTNKVVNQVFLKIAPSIQIPRDHHEGTIFKALFTPDGNFIITASADGLVKVWNQLGQPQATLRQHTAEVRHLAISPKGNFVLSADDGGGAVIWDFIQDRIAKLPDQKKPIEAIAISPDGKIMATAVGNTANLWGPTGNLTKTLSGHQGNITSISFNPGSDKVLTTGDDKSAILWDISKNPEVLRIFEHQSQVNTGQFTPDGQYVLTGTGDPYLGFSENKAVLWNLNGEKTTVFDDAKNAIQNIVVSNDGQQILTSGWDNFAYYYNIDGTLISRFRHNAQVPFATFSPDNNYILTTSNAGAALVHKTENSPPLVTERPKIVHKGPIMEGWFSPNNDMVVIASTDHNFGLWTLEGDPVTFNQGHFGKLRAVCLSNDGRTITTSGFDNKMIIWEVESGAIKRNYSLPSAPIHLLKASPDRKSFLALDENGRMTTWDWNGSRRNSFETEKGKITAACYLANGGTIAAGTTEGQVLYFKSEDQQSKPFKTWSAHQSPIRLLQSRKHTPYLLTVTDQESVLWNTDDNSELTSLGNNGDKITSAHFSADGTQLLTLSEKGEVVLVSKNQPKLSVSPFSTFEAKTADLSPKGDLVALGLKDGKIRLFRPDGELLATLENDYKVDSLYFTHDGNSLLATYENGGVQIWVLNCLFPVPLYKTLTLSDAPVDLKLR